jgi:hypothetical protein
VKSEEIYVHCLLRPFARSVDPGAVLVSLEASDKQIDLRKPTLAAGITDTIQEVSPVMSLEDA